MEEKEFLKRSFWQEIKMDVAANNRTQNFSFKWLIFLSFLSPEFQLLLSHRLQKLFLNIPFVGKPIAKVLWYISTCITSCHIDPYTKIEGGLSLPHGTGIVIGRNAIIKSWVVIYQGVTVGNDMEGNAPYIKSHARLFAGSKAIGDITIGENSIIGANAVALKSVPDNKKAVGIPARIID